MIIVKEAQYLSENLDKLIDKINSNTILIICYNDKILYKNTKLYNKIKKIGTIYNSVKLKKKEIFNFIKYEIEKIGFIITNNAIHLIIKYLGENLYKINNEIKKILILDKKKIDEKFIKKKLLKDNSKYSKLELYIVKKDLFKSYKTILHLKNVTISIVLNRIYIFFIKIIKFNLLKLNNVNFYFIKKKNLYLKAIKIYPLNKIKNIISYIRESDTKIKNSSLKNEDIIKELLYKIFNN